MSSNRNRVLAVKLLGLRPYQEVWAMMRAFTDSRSEQTSDELWMVQHRPVFTQGQAGKPEHILNPGDIPIVKSDRGGQVTYHGPGQLVAYPLLDLRRLNVGVRELVAHLEQSAISLLQGFDVFATGKPGAPGVYVEGKKIASLGIRVRRGCSFHGISLNAAMDLEPFLRINPCGYNGLQMTQLGDIVPDGSLDLQSLERRFAQCIAQNLGMSCHFDD